MKEKMMKDNFIDKNSENKRGQLYSFLQCQLGYIRKRRNHRLAILAKKLCKIPLILLALPAVFLVRILRPFVLVRCGNLLCCRVGHFATNTELYLCKREAGMDEPKSFDIFYYNAQISNYQLKKMWDRTLRVNHFAKWLDIANHLLPGARRHEVPMSLDRDIDGIIWNTPAHLTFTSDEEHLGAEELKRLGITDGNSFICFHARTSAYLEEMYPDDDWKYHDYRDSSIRNYIPAAEEMARRGYFAIRMDSVVKERLNVTNPRIIDYAVTGRTDFMDIFLSAKCKFFICSAVGIASIPMISRRPIAWVNYIPLEYAPTWGKYDLFIPKKLWLKDKRRFMTFREILDSGAGRFLNTQDYNKLGAEVVDNTAEEITALAIEMDGRLKGKWQAAEEDEQLQQRFWSLFKVSDLNKVFLSRIGTEFLRENKNLLE